MDSSFILSNILNPPVLFFFIGMVAVFLQSDLDIPLPRPKLFSLYLLFAIGFKGDREIHESGIDISIAVVAIASIIGIFIANVLGMSQGDALLFAVLCASASYIAVPAAMRMTVPEANPSLSLSMALALTFLFNIINWHSHLHSTNRSILDLS
ncbi:sodium-dependent bicarbonate transport family permease [Lusitaniella coriacea LEGE 07167]